MSNNQIKHLFKFIYSFENNCFKVIYEADPVLAYKIEIRRCNALIANLTMDDFVLPDFNLNTKELSVRSF